MQQERIEVLRQVKMEAEHFEVGDQISIELEGYGEFTATAHKVYADNAALFIFDHCVTERPMNKNGSNKGGFYESDLCRWMNEELIKAFPEKYRANMAAFDMDGKIMLRLPTRSEMFGRDDCSKYYEYESDGNGEQLELMKDRKNRICMSPDDEYCWYWLMNARSVVSSTAFAYVSTSGLAYYHAASASLGVRPAFVIENP